MFTFFPKGTAGNIAAALAAVFGVFLCKLIGLSGPAILIGALLGVVAGLIVSKKTDKPSFGGGANEQH